MKKAKVQSLGVEIKGFSIPEFLIMIAIIGIVGGIFFAVFSNLQPSLRLGSVARNLVTDLRYAQQLAVTEQINHGVYFATSAGAYKILRYGANTEEIKAKSLPAGIGFQEVFGFSGGEVKFNPYGAAQEAGAVSLVNKKAETKTIEVKPSGFVKTR